MTFSPRHPRHERPCNIDWQPSLREQNEMERESMGMARIMVALGLVCLLIVGWSMASVYFNSSATPVRPQGAIGSTQSIGDVPHNDPSSLEIFGGGSSITTPHHQTTTHHTEGNTP